MPLPLSRSYPPSRTEEDVAGPNLLHLHQTVVHQALVHILDTEREEGKEGGREGGVGDYL